MQAKDAAAFKKIYEELPNSDFEKVAGIKIPSMKVLGMGAHGIAFDIGDGLILKITDDISEANTSSLLVKHKMRGVWKIDGVYRWKDLKSTWFIVGEKCRLDPGRALKLISTLGAFFKKHSGHEDDAHISSNYGEEEYDEFLKWIVKFDKAPEQTKMDATIIFETMMDFDFLGIEFFDLHDGNIMFRGSDPVIVDLGISASDKRGKIKTFERELNMNLGPYITEAELEKGSVSLEKAQEIADKIDFDADKYDIKELKRGIEVEMEHMGTIEDLADKDLSKEQQMVAAGRVAYDHLKEDGKYYAKLDSLSEAYKDEYGRPSAAKRGYGHGWRKKRKEIINRDGGKCVKCGKRATEVDHITPKSRKGKDTNSNLRTLCGTCHRQKTKRFDRRLK